MINQINIKLKNSNIKLFSSFLSSKQKNGANQLRRPKKNYGINISNKIENNFFGALNFHLDYNYTGKSFDTHSLNFSTIEMNSTNIIDLKISKRVNNNDFFIKMSNVLNESYQRPHGYNQEGRMIKFGFGFKY